MIDKWAVLFLIKPKSVVISGFMQAINDIAYSVDSNYFSSGLVNKNLQSTEQGTPVPFCRSLLTPSISFVPCNLTEC